MPTMLVTIRAVMSLIAFGLLSGIDRANRDMASHAVPMFDGLAVKCRYTVDLRVARDACGVPIRDFAQCVGHYFRQRYG
jgi:hypothetical protein